MKTSLILCLLTVALLTGCAGYNHTLFMTKSTVGLDVDTKPPTAEITIARKEAVLAPSFEGAQTPPVLASFKPETGFNGGFGNFFMGVDQTFAGGDAAVTLAKLYGQSTQEEDPDKYNSELRLQNEPKFPILLGLFGYKKIKQDGRIKPFIFGTDTMLGLKVAWSGVGGQFPDTVKMGFNRKEFAWAPITVTNIPDQGPYHVKMPSFLATIDSNMQTGTNGTKAGALQYFATGRAASLLALQQNVRGAMLARLDPGAAEKAAEFYQQLETFELHQETFHSQAELFKAIEAVYAGTPEATIEKQKEIREEAVRLELITSGESEKNFLQVLSRKVDGSDPMVTKKLHLLVEYIKAHP